jgi:hypothetical protein
VGWPVSERKKLLKKHTFSVLAGAVLTLLISSAASTDPQGSQYRIGPDAVWKDSEQFTAKIASECGPAGIPESQKCLIATLEREHATAAAAFARRINGDGYMWSFRKVGPVDIAYVSYPFRANENNGILLVNGDPALIDVDDFEAFPKKDLENDPVYRKLVHTFPEATLFTGDRFSTEIPPVESQRGGGKSFIVPYRLNNICRACRRLALVRFGFDFDAEGKFLRIRYVGLEPADDANKEQNKH